MRKGALVLDAFIDALSWRETLGKIETWAAERESRYVCICNVHSIMTASRDAAFREVVRAADMATADGMPVVWFLRRMGFQKQRRINGPDLMWRYCGEAANRDESVFLYGNRKPVLKRLRRRLETELCVRVAGTHSPPFGDLGPDEEESIVRMINESGASVVFVSLGCPKQELWMARHRGRINAVMIGVGAAFDYHAGTVRRAPVWMQNSGLEWAHRLFSEPRRLWKRYLVTNSLFILAAMKHAVASKAARGSTKNE
jgi:N-acetylglucosaminyldiphosphoundecaprenol N-acetyl-beta-D-mannosaminyltransferase